MSRPLQHRISPRYYLIPGGPPLRALQLPSWRAVLEDNVGKRESPIRIITLDGSSDPVVFAADLSHESVPRFAGSGEFAAYSVGHMGFEVRRLDDAVSSTRVERLLARAVVMPADGRFVAGHAGLDGIGAFVRAAPGGVVNIADYPAGLVYSGIELSRDGTTLVVHAFDRGAAASKVLGGNPNQTRDHVLIYDLTRVNDLPAPETGPAP